MTDQNKQAHQSKQTHQGNLTHQGKQAHRSKPPRPGNGRESVREHRADHVQVLVPLALAGVGGVVFMLLVSAITWSRVPHRMAIHFSGAHADGYAGKTFGLLAMPVTTVALTALFCLRVLAEPHRGNLPRSARATTAVWFVVIAVLGLLHVFMVLHAIGSIHVRADTLTAMGLGALFVVVGCFLPKVRPNRVIGIRTPWTLSSRRSWDRTHRFGGVLFAVAGAIVLVAAISGTNGVLLWTAGLLVAVSTLLTGYSWWLWREDPDRVSS